MRTGLLDIPIYVINLDRAPDRLAHAADELGRHELKLRRIAAIDGTKLTDTEVAAVHDGARSRITYHVPMQRGEIACFLSHRLAWQTYLKESRAPFALFFEDDFALRGELVPVIEALETRPLPQWDLIKLWGKRKRLVRRVAVLSPSFALVREPVISKRCTGQIISRRGAESLLANTLPIVRPVDVQIQYPWELGIEILTIRPSLVVDVGRELFGPSSTKGAVERFDIAKLKREARRIVLQFDLSARSMAGFAGLLGPGVRPATRG